MQLGIDLGTTFSVVAACQRGNVTVMEVDGRRTMPSIVSALEGGHLIVGHEAAARRLTHPEDTVYNVKRIMGRRLADAGVKAELALFPYRVTEDVIPDSRSLTGKKIKGGPALRIHMPHAASPMTPQEISATVLQKLKGVAEAAQGWKAKFGFSFGSVTISVPVEFGYKQREATKRAGELAGFRQVRLVEEPVAAAMAYGLEYGDKSPRYVLVYDLGGGTLDVAILHLEDGSYRVVGTSGDPHLGGADFDQGVVELLVAKLAKLAPTTNVKEDPHAMQHLWTTAEATKRQLASLPQEESSKVDVELPYGERTTVSWGEYNTATAALYTRARAPIVQVLRDHGFQPEEMAEIVMVGGSTRMPQIRKLVKEHFKKDEIHCDIDPDEAIAVGAASGFGCGHKG